MELLLTATGVSTQSVKFSLSTIEGDTAAYIAPAPIEKVAVIVMVRAEKGMGEHSSGAYLGW